jgi:hypothetical protein
MFFPSFSRAVSAWVLYSNLIFLFISHFFGSYTRLSMSTSSAVVRTTTNTKDEKEKEERPGHFRVSGD